jgi:hypothetical protein
MSPSRSIVLYGFIATLLIILFRVFLLNIFFISDNFVHNDLLKGIATIDRLISSNSDFPAETATTGSSSQLIQFRYYSKLLCNSPNLSGKFVFILNSCIQNGDSSVNATHVISTVKKNNKTYKASLEYFTDSGCTIPVTRHPRTATFPGYNKCFPVSRLSSGDSLVVNGFPTNPPTDGFIGVGLLLYSASLDCFAQDTAPLPSPALIEKHFIAFNKCIPAVSNSQKDFQLTTCDSDLFRGVSFTSSDGSCKGTRTIFTYSKAQACNDSSLSYDHLYSGFGNYQCFS